MKSTKIILFLSIFIMLNTKANSKASDCTTSSKLANNLKDIEKITLATQECPQPTTQQFEQICDQVYTKKEASEESELSFKYQETLWKMSCAQDGEENLEEARLKVQQMWNKYRTSFSCDYPGVQVPRGNITKLSLDTGFSIFILDAVKNYKLDMNFKDPTDGKTIVDYIKEEIDRYKKSSVDVNSKIKEYENLYSLLKAQGAKHSKDL
jgi:hypothetical protein